MILLFKVRKTEAETLIKRERDFKIALCSITEGVVGKSDAVVLSSATNFSNKCVK